MKTIAEQIASFEAKRQASMGRMNEIMSAAADEGRTLDDPETQEYDGLKGEIKAVDDHLIRLKAHEAQVVATATKVTAEVGAGPDAATQSRGGGTTSIVNVKPNVEKGIPFTRYVKALAMARGNPMGALAIVENNKEWMQTSPEVAKVLMAAVAAGDTTTSGWASELVYKQNVASAFLELLMPQTILGKLTGLTKIPFNVRVPAQASGSSANWVGEGKPAPLSALAFTTIELGIAKAAGIVVMTKELMMSSDPSAELKIRNDMIKQMIAFLDRRFIAPDYAEVANISPASITYGVTPTPASGTTAAALRTDLQTLFATFDVANVDPAGAVIITTPKIARAIGLMLNALGQPTFPGVGVKGGTLLDTPVIVSNSAMQVGSPVAGEGHMLVVLNAPDIFLADEGQVVIDASGEASLEMLDNPTNQSVPTVTATSMVSMYQTNSIALRSTRFINWKKARSTAVAYLKDVAYVS